LFKVNKLREVIIAKFECRFEFMNKKRL
jgi:hypothetical protein